MRHRLKTQDIQRNAVESKSAQSELQEGWCRSALSETVDFRKGKKPAELRNEPATGFVPYLDIQAIQEQNVRQFADVASSRLSTPSDVLVVWDGARSGLVGMTEAGAIGSTIMALSAKLIEPEYLRLFIASQYELINSNTRGTGIPHVDPEVFWNLKIPLAPLAEQRRIVAKLETVLGKVSSNQQRLARIPTLLKRFRQSVLAAACSGNLTADWRESRGLAQEFESVALDEVAEYLGGFAYRSPTFTSDGKHQVIRIGNVRPMRIEISSSPVFISDSIAKETERFRLRVNDIVVSMTGTKYKRDYGYAAIVHEEDGSLYLNQRVSRIRCGAKLVPRFLLYWMHSDLFRNHFFAEETGNVNQGNVGADGIRKAPIVIPSITEQHEIVKRVEQLFTLSDLIEARFRKAQTQIDRMTQSVLAKAFRGELVPTEAELARRENRSYEPASELLARIEITKTERSAGSTAKRRRIKPQP